jgi:glycosyltransferase involved in cell wall biosynthesis
MEKFEKVSLLVTHYNRSASLERLLTSFGDLGIAFGDIVVSDDCSKPEHLDRLKELQSRFGYRLITTPKNGGLGNNINKGQDAVKTPLTIYVQEDFVPKPLFKEKFREALDMMEERPDLDIIRFYAYFMYPTLKPYRDGFSEMFFNPWLPDHWKFNFYSDHPHLRRSTFLQKFGRYPEGLDVNKTEFHMCLSFIKRKGRGLFYTGIYDLFDQVNTSTEPSTFYRANWRQSKHPVLLFLRAIYLKFKLVKNTIQLIKMK